MADEIVQNFPDVIGYVTGGQRYNIGVVQIALGIRPRVLRAGRSFEVILLVQNASDVDIDVTATLHLPEVDAAKKKGRFVTKASRLVVGLQPAEVGYVLLPVSTMPDAAPSGDYKIGVDVKAAPAAKGSKKPQRVRQTEGGGEFDPSNLSEDVVKKIEELKQINFSTSPRNRLTPNVIEVQFSMMSGKLGEIVDFKPGWVSVWTMRDHHDERLLLYRYRESILNNVLPKLKRARLFPALLETTTARFEQAGYPLNEIEALLIGKLLTLILEYASPSEAVSGGHGGLAAGNYNIAPLLEKDRLADPRPIVLPKWATRFLHEMGGDPRAAEFPIETIMRSVYFDLMRDAMLYAFQNIETITGEELGDETEMGAYADSVIEMLQTSGQMDFTHTYMPLVLGGLVLFDNVIMPGEKLDELVSNAAAMLEQREHEKTSDNELVFSIAHRLLDRAVMKYGIKLE